MHFSTPRYLHSPLDPGEQQASGSLPPFYMDTRMWSGDTFISGSPLSTAWSAPYDLAGFNTSPGPAQIEYTALNFTSVYSTGFPPPSLQVTATGTAETPSPHSATQAQVSLGDVPQVAHSTSQDGTSTPNPSFPSHTYRQIFIPVDHATADNVLSLCEVNGDRAYRCLWVGCDRHPFKSKYNARAHVQSHLGPARIFECVNCPAQFASEASARRHRDTRTNKSQCSFCHKMYSRKDYRDVHQKKSCPARPSK